MRGRGLGRCVLLGLLSMALAACGFGLRQPVQYPFSTLYSSMAPSSSLGLELKRQLQAGGALDYITDPDRRAQAQVLLDVFGEQRLKTAVAYSTAGQVREFQLRLTLKFRLRTPLGKELVPETELVQQRTMSYSEAQALSKEVEEAMLYRNMQSDMVQQIMRRLAAVRAL